MITGYAILKKGAAAANRASGRLDDTRYKLIVQTCDESWQQHQPPVVREPDEDE
jgi:aspartate ammonia-lyase